MLTVKDAELSDKRILLRVDFNVPVDENGEIQDDSRIKAAVPTISHILEQRPRQLIIMSHLGEPEGKVVENLKLDKVSERLTQILEKTVYKTKDCIVSRMPGEGLILLENVRFHKEEMENSDEFAAKLASYGDIYINDAFGVCHREHASVHAITKLLPSYIGFLIEKELANLDIDKMERPVYSVLGGGKLKTKIPLIKRMLLKTDKVIAGGGMIFTFYKAKRWETGQSVVDDSYMKDAEMMVHNENLYLPEDIVTAESTAEGMKIRTVAADALGADMKGLDVGEASMAKIKEMLKNAKTILWNGPLGYYEKPPFDKATNELAQYLSELTCTRIIGGGDTAEVVHALGLESKFTFISSGGGAALEVLSGSELAAMKAMRESQARDDADQPDPTISPAEEDEQE